MAALSLALLQIRVDRRRPRSGATVVQTALTAKDSYRALILTALRGHRRSPEKVCCQAFCVDPTDHHAVEIDSQHCPSCGGELEIIAAIVEGPGIGRILTHLGLQASAPPQAPERGNTQPPA
jgi:hypothetical protein